MPGVLVTPPPDVPGYHVAGYGVVLDSPGDRRIQVISQVRRLTGLSLPDARELICATPVPVLRVPDLPMARAARTILESAGAAVSITGPAS